MPTADSNSIFGRIITRRDLSLKFVDLLREWVPTYIGQLEEQAQLPTASVPMPPDPIKSYRIGLDFDTWMPSWAPMFIVVAQPVGEPERMGNLGSYTQIFDVQVGCNYQFNGNLAPALDEIEEDSAVQYADILGMAACTSILQHGGIGTWPDGTLVSTKTVLSQYPRTTFPFPGDELGRRTCRSTFGVLAVVTNVVTEYAGPAIPMANPYVTLGDWPVVGSAGVIINAYPDDTNVPPGF